MYAGTESIKAMKRFFQNFAEALSVVLIFILLVAFFVFMNLTIPASSGEKWMEINIPKGLPYSKAVTILKNEGIIRSRFALLVLGKVTMKDRQIRPGYYNLSASMTPLQIFDKLIKGKSIYYTVTIPEGYTLEDIKLKLKETGLVNDQSWEIVYDKDFLMSLDIYAPSLEGYLFPDTYYFAKGTEPTTIFKTMVQRMRENFDQPLLKRASEIGMSENDVLTLASIIEKEALLDSERPIISAVYHNRLKKHIRLQADPTVVYGIRTYSRVITKKDLKRKTPYNTYVIKGLPPGPIASPGLKSIRAALYPAKVNYLYFVSKNDGSHYFSRTNAEHARAVLLYQRNNESTGSQNEKEKVN